MANETRTAESCLVEEQVSNIPSTKVHYRLEERLKKSIQKEKHLLYGILQIKLLFESVLNNKSKDEQSARPVSESLTRLEDSLRKEPYFYDFFQMKRLFECVLNDKSRFEQSLKSPIFLEKSLQKKIYLYGYCSYYGSRHFFGYIHNDKSPKIPICLENLPQKKLKFTPMTHFFECVYTDKPKLEQSALPILKPRISLEDSLQQDPTRYGFFQVMRLLECAHKENFRFGQSQRPSHEPTIRLGQDVSLSFESATLSSFSRLKTGLPLLKQRAFGLFGPNGSMPLHLTEYIHERIHHHRDHTLTGFVDMFHHRMICLFYRAWANTEPTVSFDRPKSDRFSTYIGSLAGLGTNSLRDRDAMPDIAKFHYTGFLSNQSKSAEGLRALLADYFRLTVSIEQFAGEWLTIQDSDLTRLGESPLTGELGRSAILGSQVWGCQHKFRIRFGSLNLSEYMSLLPNSYRLEQLVSIIRNYSGDELSWDVLLELKKDQVPQARLGETTHLGWTSWLGERSSDYDADDLRLNPFWGKL